MIFAGEWALRFSPAWMLNTSLESHIDPNGNFLTKPVGFFEPVDPAILTQPAWVQVFLTPGAKFATKLPPSVALANTLAVTPGTMVVPVTGTNPVATPTAVPSNTLIWFPATATSTRKPRGSSTNTPALPGADLQITKDDSVAAYVPGGTLTYTIVVSNPVGPSHVTGAAVTDNFPAQVTGAGWTCTGMGGGVCTASGAGHIHDVVNLPVGSAVTYTVNVNIGAGTSGNLVNTASVSIPAGYTESNPANNTATDTDNPLPTANLVITKTDHIATYAAGSTRTYEIVVSNPVGPSHVTGATVTDNFPAQVAGASWTCGSTNGGSCTANGTGNINDPFVDLPVGSSVTYTVNVNIDTGASGDLINTASVSLPGGYAGTTPVSATDTDTPEIDLQIIKSDGVTGYTAGGALTYTVDVTNDSTFAVNGVTVTDPFSAQIQSTSWSCAPLAGAPTCIPASGTGNLNNTLNLPAGSSARYTIAATISSLARGPLTNTASVTAPADFTELDTGNNSATDTDAGPNGGAGGGINFGPGDGTWSNPGSGRSITMIIPAIIANGDVGTYDLVYYERVSVNPPPAIPPATDPRTDFDSVQVEISPDGSTWYTVFYWGDGAPDANTNVAVPIDGIFCSGEPDNCQIPAGYMYNSTGAAIDIDAIVPSGSYPYIRLSSPAGGGENGDGCDIDAIQILPP